MTRPSSVSGATVVYGLVGDPVAHSLSPALHAAAFEALGIDATSVALRAGVSGARTVVDAVRSMGISGLSVTMPLKAAVVAHCEHHADVVGRLGAANCLTATPDGVRADSTDGDGLVAAIACAARRDVAGMSCAVLGAGGAARAAVEALGRAGATEVLVVARRPEAALAAAALAPTGRPADRGEAAAAAVIVQATPVGMDDTAEAGATALVDPSALAAGQVAVDLVYHPRVTAWLSRAESSGATTVPGIEVLVHQAALALSIWLRAEVPLGPLHEAVAP